MKNKEEIKEMVENTINKLGNYNKGKVTKFVRENGVDYSRVKTEEKSEIIDAAQVKDKLSKNIDETVRLTIIKDLRMMLNLLGNVKDINKIPGIADEGIGKYCKLTMNDIKDLNLDDKEFVNQNFEEILQSLYESYGYEGHLMTIDEISELKRECAKARIEKKTRTETLEMEKQYKIAEVESGKGEFSITGLPLKLGEDIEAEYETRIAQAKERETGTVEKFPEESKITGQQLGEQTLKEQKESKEKEVAKKKLEELRAKHIEERMD